MVRRARSPRPEAETREPAEPLDDVFEAGFRYALALCGDASDAEDLLQDGWLSLLRADGPRRRGYLFRCIRSRFVDRHRRGRLVAIDPVPAEALEAFPGDGATPIEERIDARSERVAEALAALRPEERETLYLHAVEGFSAGEIAELSEAPRGSVLSRIHRARAKLRAALTRGEEGS